MFFDYSRGMPANQPLPFRQRFVLATSIAPLLLAALVSVGWLGGVALQDWGRDLGAGGASVAPDVREDVPAAEGSPRAVVEAHDCWAGAAPADMVGVIPGHVVVTVDQEVRYAGERMVGLALEQTFGGVDHGLVVHGFCR